MSSYGHNSVLSYCKPNIRDIKLTILFFSWALKDGALSRWAGAGALDWDQPVGLWLGELPALEIQGF